MNGADAGGSRTIIVRTGTIDTMMMTSGATVIGFDTATATTVRVGATVGVAVGIAMTID